MRIVFDTQVIKSKFKRFVLVVRRGLATGRQEWKDEKDKDALLVYRTEQLALLQRADMDVFSLNTGVVRATAADGRIAVGGSFDSDFGDCLSIRWRQDGDSQGQWRVAHYSAARARIIALHLLTRAEDIERQYGALNIDGAPETLACIEKRKVVA